MMKSKNVFDTRWGHSPTLCKLKKLGAQMKIQYLTKDLGSLENFEKLVLNPSLISKIWHVYN